MRALFIAFIFTFILISCKSEEKKLTAQQIIDKSIAVSGVEKITNSLLSFDFRDLHYSAYRNNGGFKLVRIKKSEEGTREDILSNKGFERLFNAHPVQVPDSMALKYSESINSVHYFSVLPYGLNDGAVQKKLLVDKTIKGKEFYKVQITFKQEGGGIDFDDVFIYWIGKEDFKIDYMAYTFHVNGGGKRFREVRNEHLINGVRLTDHNNYKPNDASVDLSTLDLLFESNQLKKLSEINLENIQLSFN
ncbi:MAG: deoxyribose-phosphate aldolase [Flavobacteriaceae bacterium]|nr:deoxyribose-phosphate aldolase [Flavobacteriaceae bacterium]